jgi:hypothetical protein
MSLVLDRDGGESCMTDSQNLEMEAIFSSVTLEVKRILHGAVSTDLRTHKSCSYASNMK